MARRWATAPEDIGYYGEEVVGAPGKEEGGNERLSG